MLISLKIKSPFYFLAFVLFANTLAGQKDSGQNFSGRQRLNEMRYDLINGTINNSIRVLGSPIKFGWKEWAGTAACAGLVGASFALDENVFNGIQNWQGNTGGALATYVGEPFGNPLLMTTTSLGVYLVSKGIGYQPVARPALLAFQSVAIGGASAYILKILFHRQRPNEGSEANPWVWYGPSFKNENLSFPSGHTATAFALASSLSSYYHQKKWVAFVLYPLAGLTAWSRIYDNQHWFSDVVAGAALGTFVGYTVAHPDKYKWTVLPNATDGLGLNFSYHF